MRGAALPAALLCVALGLALAYSPRRAVAPALIALAASAVVTVMVIPPIGSREVAFFGCWASVIFVALIIHLPGGIRPLLATAIATSAGFWAGSVISSEGVPSDLARALPCALLCIPARWVAGRGWGLGIQVVSSWLIAIAILAALLPTTGTPGYVPDHMG